MRNVSGDQCKVKMSGSDISANKRVIKMFLEFSRCSHAIQKKCAAHAKLLFC